MRRQYTIANAMRQPAYKNLVDAIKGQGEIDKSLISGEVTNQVSTTIKTYNLDKGIARLFFKQDKKEQQFTVKGPMGRGLGLTPESDNVHIAFAAGTGVLVFIDLVARLALQMIGAIPE